MATLNQRAEHQSIFGSARGQSVVAVDSKEGTPSGLRLVDSAGTVYTLWIDTTGDLKISTVDADFTTNPNTAGTVVGTQS